MSAPLPTLAEIRSAHASRAEYERFLFANTYFFRPLSYPLTWAAIRTGLSSETVSWLSGSAAVAGLACLFLPFSARPWCGAALLALFNLLDCVDGDISRVMRTRNPYGRFLDSIMGFADMLFWAAVGVVAWRTSDLRALGDISGAACLWAGGAAAFLSVYASYLENVFDLSLRQHWERLNSAVGEPTSGPLEGRGLPLRLTLILMANLRVRETHYILFAAACIGGALDLLLAFFLAVNVALVFALLFVYCGRGVAVRSAGLGAEKQ